MLEWQPGYEGLLPSCDSGTAVAGCVSWSCSVFKNVSLRVTDAARVLAIALLVAGNAVFVAAEYALVTARRQRLQPKADGGSRSAASALDLMDNPVGFISTVQIAITMFGLALGAVGEPLVSHYLSGLPEALSFVLAFVILTYLSVAFGELVPKAVALQKAEAYAQLVAIPISMLQRVTLPLVWVLQVSANAAARLFGVRPAPVGDLATTEEEIREILAGAGDAGVIEEAEEEMLYRVFDFADKEASTIMTPRPEVIALAADLGAEECVERAGRTPYSRFPVYRGSLDEIIGILHIRDLLWRAHEGPVDDPVELVRPALTVPETKDLGSLLVEFRKTKQQMACVVDEYGLLVGIVTLEDVLEEIVGEIEDEFDLPDESVVRTDDGRLLVHGTFPIDDFNEEFGTLLESAGVHTLAGLAFSALGRAAHPGDEIEIQGIRFRVVAVAGTRIRLLELELPAAG